MPTSTSPPKARLSSVPRRSRARTRHTVSRRTVSLRTVSLRRLRALWLSVAAVAVCGLGAALAPWSEAPQVEARETLEHPVFSNPAAITNTYMPLVPGSVKIYSGKDKGVDVIVVESCLIETRDFAYDGGTVTCRILDEMHFTNGALAGREQSFLAQATDGSVWKFGEIEDDDQDDDDGDDADEPGGWIVGKLSASDPTDVVETDQPSLFMPKTPTAGDSWANEQASPQLQARMSVLDASSRVRLPTGRHTRCLRVREFDIPDKTSERLWFAPGLGLVKLRAPRCRLTLQATTIRERKR